MIEEFGWLIERSEAGHFEWFAGLTPKLALCWTRNPDEAVRFARRVDAEKLMGGSAPRAEVFTPCSIQEHGWAMHRSLEHDQSEDHGS